MPSANTNTNNNSSKQINNNHQSVKVVVQTAPRPRRRRPAVHAAPTNIVAPTNIIQPSSSSVYYPHQSSFTPDNVPSNPSFPTAVTNRDSTLAAMAQSSQTEVEHQQFRNAYAQHTIPGSTSAQTEPIPYHSAGIQAAPDTADASTHIAPQYNTVSQGSIPSSSSSSSSSPPPPRSMSLGSTSLSGSDMSSTGSSPYPHPSHQPESQFSNVESIQSSYNSHHPIYSPSGMGQNFGSQSGYSAGQAHSVGDESRVSDGRSRPVPSY